MLFGRSYPVDTLPRLRTTSISAFRGRRASPHVENPIVLPPPGPARPHDSRIVVQVRHPPRPRRPRLEPLGEYRRSEQGEGDGFEVHLPRGRSGILLRGGDGRAAAATVVVRRRIVQVNAIPLVPPGIQNSRKPRILVPVRAVAADVQFVPIRPLVQIDHLLGDPLEEPQSTVGGRRRVGVQDDPGTFHSRIAGGSGDGAEGFEVGEEGADGGTVGFSHRSTSIRVGYFLLD
mmetsp:Transcript_32810/g.62673  ORF Transcript_32810/g.62673 Transcript_32810/m.62673 type:complete len:232 (+) Transcript_32810:369-1064(+)